MAFGRLERGNDPQPMSEINMTPLIDVMLVLLIIFMLTAPLLASSLKLDLPKSEAAAEEGETEAVMLAITPDGALHWGEEAVTDELLADRLAEVARRNPQQEVQLRADRAVPYGRVAELIGMLQKAGLSRIAFVTEAPADARPESPAASASR